MRRTLCLSLLLTLLCNWLYAERVSQQEAENWALQFFKQQAATRNAEVALKMVWNGEKASVRGGNGAPAFYVFNRTDRPGFVIVSGEDATRTILGFSLETAFETKDMPENLSAWMNGLRDQINWIRNKQQQQKTVTRGWTTRDLDMGEVKVIYETPKWGQGSPYNRMCPVFDGKSTKVGCVIVSTAIAMRHRRWPEAGTGHLPTYNYKRDDDPVSHTIDGIDLGNKYNWDNMPLELTEESPEAQINEVAALFRDLGILYKASYGTSGTGVSSAVVPSKLLEHMHYSPQITHLRKKDFKLTDWYELLNEELEHYGPVVYDGDSEEGGHSFILDGYTTNHYYSLNWGWRGTANGYYLLDPLQPVKGTHPYGEPYSSGQGAIVNMFPIRPGEVAEEGSKLAIQSGTFKTESYEFGMRSSTNDYQPGCVFSMNVGNVKNSAQMAYSGEWGVAVFSKDHRWKQNVNVTRMDVADLEYNYFRRLKNIECKLPMKLEKGDYLAMAEKSEFADSWSEIPGWFGTQHQLPLEDADDVIQGDLLFLSVPSNPTSEYNGIRLETKDVRTGADFVLHTDVIRNAGYEDLTFKLNVGLYAANGDLLEVISEQKSYKNFTVKQYLKASTFTCRITKQIPEGAYLSLCYQPQFDNSWYRMRGVTDVVDKLVLGEQQPEPVDLEAETAFGFVKDRNVVVIETVKGTDYTLLNEKQEVVSQGTCSEQGMVELKAETLPAGVLTLKLMNGEAKAQLQFKLK